MAKLIIQGIAFNPIQASNVLLAIEFHGTCAEVEQAQRVAESQGYGQCTSQPVGDGMAYLRALRLTKFAQGMKVRLTSPLWVQDENTMHTIGIPEASGEVVGYAGRIDEEDAYLVQLNTPDEYTLERPLSPIVLTDSEIEQVVY